MRSKLKQPTYHCRQVDDIDEDDVPTPTQTEQRRPRDISQEEDDDVEDDEHSGAGSLPHLSKSLVRYALACEYSRTPIKRADITSKVMGLHKTVKFKDVFDHANGQLMDTFGMMMVELPNREKMTMKQKRGMHHRVLRPPRLTRLQLRLY